MSSYIPTNEPGMLDWMNTFATGLQANPELYGIAASEAEAVREAVDAFAAAREIALDPVTRSPFNVNLKDNARNAAEQICRQYVTLIKPNAGISDAAKIAIGVRPVNNTREPIHCPTESPALNVVAATPGAHTVRFADSIDPEQRGKPFGAACLQLFVCIKDTPTMNEDEASFVGLYTKNPIAVAFEPADDGKMATYFGRWSGKRGDVGNWSLPVSMRIAA